MKNKVLFCILMLAGISGAQDYSVDFREAASIPSAIVAAGDLQAGDLSLANVAGEQVLAVDLSGVTSDYGSKVIIGGLNRPVEDDDPLYLIFHYKPVAPKAADGIINFELKLTINGVETFWSAATQSGVINTDQPLDNSDWWLAFIDMQPLLDHWRVQTGSTGDMFVNKIHIGPGATNNPDEQYRNMLYFRGIHFGSSATTLNVTKGGNLLINGDFSDGLTGWSVQETAPADAEATVYNTANYEYYADITHDDGVQWDAQVRQDTLTLVNGQEYRLSFDARAEADCLIDVYFKSGLVFYGGYSSIGLNTNMQTYSKTFTVSEATAGDICLLFFLGGRGENNVWLDNVLLEATSNPGVNLLSNGDFSNGTADWLFVANGTSTGNGSVLLDAAGIQGELYCNVISDSGVSYHLQMRQDSHKLRNGKAYRLSFDARAEFNRTMRANLRSNTLLGYLNYDVSLTTNMTTFTTDFAVTKPTVDDVALNFHLGAAGENDVWLDNVSLKELSEDDDLSWILQNEIISIQPKANGTLYLSKIRQPYTFYMNGLIFDEAEYASHAGITRQVVAGQIYLFDTRELNEGAFNQVSGSCELMLVNNGLIEAVHPFHLAFRDVPVSPDYEVSVQADGDAGFSVLPTFFSYMPREQVRLDNSGAIMSIKKFDEFNVQPIASHSFAGISTDDYPVTVRVKVLNHAFAPNTYFDETERFSYPLSRSKVIPSSYGIPCTVIGNDTIEFTLDRPRKVLVVPNYEAGMDVFRNLALGYGPLESFEIGKSDLPLGHPARDIPENVNEGFKNPLMFFARTADALPADLGFSETDPGTLVINSGDRPTQEELSAADTVWFKPGTHDLSRLGESLSYKTHIEAGQTFYLEEGAFVAATFKKPPQPGQPDDDPGGADCRLVGRGIVTGINHFWGGVPGFWHGNGFAIEINEIDGITFTDRASFGITGGDRINDIANLGVWHEMSGGIGFIDHCIVSDSFLTAGDDNLKISNGTTAENLVIMQLTPNAHAILVHEMVDNVTYANTTIRDVDIIGTWSEMIAEWQQLFHSYICCLQGRNVNIQNFTFSDIRIEAPYVHRILSFYNLHKQTPQGENGAYTPRWFPVTTEEHHAHIDGLTFENITVDTPYIVQKSVLGSGYSNSFANVSIANFVVNGETVTESNRDDYFEVSGYVLGTDPADGGSGRIDIPAPVANLTFHDSLYSAWAHGYGLVLGTEGDDDLDGEVNLAEFALGGNPVDPADRGMKPEFLAGAGGFSYVHPVLAKRNPGLIYTIETTDNLASNVWNTVGYTVSGTSDLGGDFNVVSNWIPIGVETQKFFRLNIREE
ncbi:carbohydrate binding domain-containing protein [Pontiella sulfatireligans]|uniref:CBM-cenC domain-containing protein n=1 Tax=Pontiella sulfatireligans TaxID=2750658 RepID=A0A6C2UKS4_9BACT|nr:carbohydrate binding domain-containing protein [Pontiella sulfatireligans]VGO20835.1 hypothetical protein SCARR_02902 [Pontiella sulfatireligans]